MISILLDENKCIIGYNKIGQFVNGIDVEIEIPNDFKPYKYKFVDNQLIKNEDYIEIEEIKEVVE